MDRKFDLDDTFHAGPEFLNPREALEGRSNFKRLFMIYRDGSIRQRVRLHVLDRRLREEIICRHYLQMLVRHVIRDDVGIRILSRDQPWDFQIECSTGDEFGVEIVSIADNRAQFEIDQHAELRDADSYNNKISFRRLKKIAKTYPDGDLDTLVAKLVAKGVRPDDMVDNPDHPITPKIYVSRNPPPDETLAQRIDQAIRSKEQKRSGGKDKLVLIIDNRTSEDKVVEFQIAASELRDRLSASPFKEIWLYTGYCSDADGNGGEYCFISLLVGEGVAAAFQG